jgi:transcriptional regulator with XRE-family HTH domain
MNNRQLSIYVGMCCKKFRHMLGYTQQEVAFEIGTTRDNIAKFESGQNRNYLILLWYVLHDFKIHEAVMTYVNESERNFTAE